MTSLDVLLLTLIVIVALALALSPLWLHHITERDFDIMNIRKIVIYTCIGLGLFTTIGMAGCPHYDVWQKSMSGRAQLAEASWNRQIKTQEAQAQKESAKFLAEAEIERATGVAQANLIIGNSLKGNESYLRYLWIQSLSEKQKEVIYVPTEANLPILEANRLTIPPAPVK